MKAKLCLTLAIVALCASCWAPIKDPRTNVKIQQEASQSELAQEQALQKVQGVVGYVPAVTDRQDVDPTPSNSAAGNDLAKATARLDGTLAQQNLDKANSMLHRPRATMTTMGLWGFLFLTLGLGAAFAFRQWANKVVPDMPKPKRVTW